MALFSFYKQRKPRQYDHKPIYWDPRKEDLEMRERRVRRELGMQESLENYKPDIKGSFVEGTTHLKRSQSKGHTERSRRYSNVRLGVILAVLIVLFYVLFIR